jgi:hypothetical protein
LAARSQNRAVEQTKVLAKGGDIPWTDYHECAVKATQTLLTAHAGLLPARAGSTQPLALAQPDWPERRMVMAVAAATAAALFVQATNDVESFSARRFGLTSLSLFFAS